MSERTKTSGPIIEAVELSKWFGEVVAVNHLDLEVSQGVTGLLGPNGAGKTTLIRLILGLYKASRGSIRVYGEDLRNNLNVLRRIGYCPELDRFFDGMTGLEFVRWLCRYSGMSAFDAEAAACRACEIVHMSHRMDDPIDTYSQGMRQRIRIAQSIAHEPDLLILDEPMSGLDPEGREGHVRAYSRTRRDGALGDRVEPCALRNRARDQRHHSVARRQHPRAGHPS